MLTHIVAALPRDFPAAIIVLQHTTPGFRTQLPEMLAGKSRLPAKIAEEGDMLQPGQIFVAPSGRHLLVRCSGVLALTDSERVSFARPAADLLLISVAIEFRERAMAVVVSGYGQDAAVGMRAVKGAGGCTIAEERVNCPRGMPEAAIETGCIDLILPADKIGKALIALTMTEGAPSWFQSAAGMN